MGTTTQEDIFYASYGAGRTRKQFNADWSAFTKGLAAANSSQDGGKARQAFLYRVRRMGK